MKLRILDTWSKRPSSSLPGSARSVTSVHGSAVGLRSTLVLIRITYSINLIEVLNIMMPHPVLPRRKTFQLRALSDSKLLNLSGSNIPITINVLVHVCLGDMSPIAVRVEKFGEARPVGACGASGTYIVGMTQCPSAGARGNGTRRVSQQDLHHFSVKLHYLL